MNETTETTEITHTEEIEVSVEPVADATPPTNTQSQSETQTETETLSQPVETTVSTPTDSTFTDVEVVNKENTNLFVVKETKTMETVEKKDNKSLTKRALEKQNLIYEVLGLVGLIILIVVVKLLILRRRANTVTEKVTKKDKDFLKLIYHLNHVYTKTDNYLKQKS